MKAKLRIYGLCSLFLLTILVLSHTSAQEGLPAHPLGTLVTRASANLRSEPTTSSAIVESLRAGTQLTIIEIVEDGERYSGNATWYAVENADELRGYLWSGLATNVVLDYCDSNKHIPGMISFEAMQEPTHVYVIEPNGCNLRHLVSEEQLIQRTDENVHHDEAISWSLDGNAAILHHSYRWSQVFLLNRDGLIEKELTFLGPNGTPHNPSFPQLSQDGKTVAACVGYLPTAATFNYRGIGTRQVNGSNVYTLYLVPDMTYVCPPAISPNGQFVTVPAIASVESLERPDYQGYAPVIWLINLETQEKKSIGPGHRADWSPDSTQIAYAGYAENAGVIYLYTIENGELIELTPANSAIDTHRTNVNWSHDGKYIAHYGLVDGTGGVFITDPVNMTSRRITPVEIDYPVFRIQWSPDDRYIAFFTASNQNAKEIKLYVVEILSGQARQILQLPVANVIFVLLDSFEWVP